MFTSPWGVHTMSRAQGDDEKGADEPVAMPRRLDQASSAERISYPPFSPTLAMEYEFSLTRLGRS